MRSGCSRDSILWVLLVSGRFCVAKTIIPEAGSTFLSLHDTDTLIFRRIGAKPESTERMRGGWIRKGKEAWVMAAVPDPAVFGRVRVVTATPGGC